MKLCFLTIQVKTPLFFGIAQRLSEDGHEICWISPSRRWSQWLLKRGVDPSRLLDITQFSDEWQEGTTTSTTLRRLEAFERDSDKSVRDLILMDRWLSLRPEAAALAYIAACADRARTFLERQQVDVVFAEHSFALSYVVAELCDALKIANFNPDTVRFPDGRFGFFEGMYQARLVPVRAAEENDRLRAKAFYDRFSQRAERPAYFYESERAPKLEVSLGWKLIRNAIRAWRDPHDETEYRLGHRVADRVRERWNYALARRMKALHSPARGAERPFVLYGVHRQPEISVDVFASHISNQQELIRCLARSLPIGYDLYVKAHRHDLGGLSRRFFDSVSRLPRVRVVDPRADSHELINDADLVISISGTMCYEAGLYGRRAITLAPMFFSPLLLASGVDPYSIALSDFEDLLSRPHPQDDSGTPSPVEFLADVMAQSFAGVISDPMTDPDCVRDENLDAVTQGFRAFLPTLR